MKLFIDTADIDQIKEAAAMGAIDGVTTNPSLLAQVGKTNEQVIPEICEIVNGPISAEVFATDEQGILSEGRALAKIHPNVVVKVPLIVEGLKAVRRFTDEGIQTNVTLCFSPTQALLAAKAGATFVSPFVGRLDDISQNGMGLIEQILSVYRNFDLKTEVLVASVRHCEHVVESLLMGAHAATVPLSVIKQLCGHPMTDKGLARFLEDAKKLQG